MANGLARFQGLAEDLFLSQSVSLGGGHELCVLDTGSNLLKLCAKLLYREGKPVSTEDIRRLRSHLKSRPRAGLGDPLTFERFVELYNEYVLHGWRAPPTHRRPPTPPMVPAVGAVFYGGSVSCSPSDV